MLALGGCRGHLAGGSQDGDNLWLQEGGIRGTDSGSPQWQPPFSFTSVSNETHLSPSLGAVRGFISPRRPVKTKKTRIFPHAG